MNPGSAVYMARKKAMELKQRFLEKEAASPESALTVEELEVRKKGMFCIMLLKKHIVEVGGKYYLDLQVANDSAIEKLLQFVHKLTDE